MANQTTRVEAIIIMSRKPDHDWRRSTRDVNSYSSCTRGHRQERTCPSRAASHQGQGSSKICLDPAVPALAAAPLPIRIICDLRKAAHLHERSVTNGLSPSVEGIIARFIATVTSATGGKEPALTRTLPHEVCGSDFIPRVRGNVAFS